MDLNKLEAYDIETYPNCFTLYIGNIGTRKCKGFEISFRRDDRIEMIEYLRGVKRNDAWMVGFNNLGFDEIVLHYILRNQNVTVEQIYEKAMAIIKSQNEEKREHMIRPNKRLIKQLDLFKIHHFDNKARATSLKMLEFNMRSRNIEDLPFPVGTMLTSDQIDTLLTYNKHDLKETLAFLMHTIKQIEFREQLTEQYDRNFMNHNDTKIGKDYFIMKLEEANPGCCYNSDTREIMQTKRPTIDLSECILPYVVFYRPEFNAVKNWIASQTITETKGVFTDILESDLGDLAQYCTMRTKRKKLFVKPTPRQLAAYKKKHPMGWFEEKELKSKKLSYYWCWNVADNLNCVIDGFQYDFGTGGLHGAMQNSIYVSTKKRSVQTKDVKSYYPNISIRNRLYPEHLGEGFCDIYEYIYDLRISYASNTPENKMLKLSLNGTYGESNNQYSPFYDPKFTMMITINGQLMLCMLAEALMTVPTLKVIMVNTDGLEYTVDREYIELANQKCREWEQTTMLTLEGDEYKKIFIRDVNSYIAVS